MMTIYERKMEIIFETDMDDVSFHPNKVQGMLYDRGIAQTSNYNYDNPDEDARLYGFKETDATTTTYAITDEDGQVLMELDYSSQARLAQKGLTDYGINTDVAVVNTTTTMDKWMRVRGPYLGIYFGPTNGEQSFYGRATLKYDDNVSLTARLDNYGHTYTLTFKITYEVDSITNRKAVEDRVVQVPLAEMLRIRKAVEQTLAELSAGEITHTVDCETKIISEATYQCSPETTKLVMEDEEE
tara:strand:- start:201 stop:926 length:726 start_codon:yes stop_codon:yes gene_type:complete